MSALQPVRGTHDLLPAEERRHRHVGDVARALSGRFGFQPIETPIFEFTTVFTRGIGEATDIVAKEMYSFVDRSGDSITLRPENTAAVARALVSNGLTQSLPQKFFYHGAMFRHERPQKGRQRQFHQIGVEYLGSALPIADVEVIACGVEILEALGVMDGTVLELNTLGDTESRLAYRAALVEYFSGLRDQLSEDSQRRLDANPLRILDSKDAGDQALVEGAPLFEGYLNPLSQDFFGAVKAGLDALGIAYQVTPRLVRGIDYYCHTAFEFVSNRLGAQATVMAGGRYDGLVRDLGGPDTPGVGWASGVERIVLLASEPPAGPRPVAVFPLEPAAEGEALRVCRDLRAGGFIAELVPTGKLPKRLARAEKLNAAAAVLIGGDELAKGMLTLRDLDAREQSEVPRGHIVAAVAALPGERA